MKLSQRVLKGGVLSRHSSHVNSAVPAPRRKGSNAVTFYTVD